MNSDLIIFTALFHNNIVPNFIKSSVTVDCGKEKDDNKSCFIEEEEGSMPRTTKSIHCPYLCMYVAYIYFFLPNFNVFYVSNDCIYMGSSIIVYKSAKMKSRNKID